jgi:hypothetical protein
MPGAEGSIYVPSDGVIRGGSTLHVTVYWQALGSPAGDASVVVRLVDSAGHAWLERRNRHPVGGTYPTSRWQAKEVVGDYYELALPPYLPSGEYQLSVSVGTLSDVRVDATLAALSVHKPLRWPRPLAAHFGGTPALAFYDVGPGLGKLALVGYEAPPDLAPRETVSIALQWLICECRAIDPLPASALVDARPRLALVLREGTEIPLAVPTTSMVDWQPGALAVDAYAFSVPDDLARVEVQSAFVGGKRYRLPLQIAAAPPPGANFGDLARLRDHRYEDTSLKPGDTVHVVLEWEGLRRMDEAFKVFVHVLGPDGLPVAQQDSEPVNGTYPTTQWQPGERITDPYTIRLPGNLPLGEYAVEVGLYRISDLSRLPVLDQDRSVVDDKVYLEPLTVR